MGSKQTWKRKYIFLYLACIITIFSGMEGCTNFAKKTREVQHGSADTNVTIESDDNKGSLEEIKEVLSLFPEFAKKWQGKQDLAIAKTYMFKGDYNSSILVNKKVLDECPKALGDQALFQMGLTYVHPENPEPDNQKSLECFQRIIDEFPKSSIRDEAGIWILILQKIIKSDKRYDNLMKQKNFEDNKKLESMRLKNENLQHQIENLKSQINKLKEIDLGIEGKKKGIDLPEGSGETQ